VSHRDTRWSGLIRRAAVGGVLFLISLVGITVQAEEPAPALEIFVRSGCPHCEAAKSFLADIREDHPGLRIVVYDIAEDAFARNRLSRLGTERGLASLGVPAFLIGSELIIGFQSADTTGKEILARLDRPPERPSTPAAVESIQSRWLGELRVTDLGLPLFTITIGLLDGFNPCAMWVLLFLLSLLANLRNRRKMALIAGTFVLVSGLVYFAFMAAWLNIFLLIGLSRAIQIGLGGIALLIGSVNVKDFFALHRGLSLSIPESAKPGLYARTRQILQAEHLAGALAGVVLLAGFVNLVELLCTAGLPALYTQILTMQQIPAWKYYAYLGLYNLAYVFDDSLMVILAVITLSRTKLQERAGRWLKLTSGLVMVGLGAILLLQPKWLM